MTLIQLLESLNWYLMKNKKLNALRELSNMRLSNIPIRVFKWKLIISFKLMQKRFWYSQIGWKLRKLIKFGIFSWYLVQNDFSFNDTVNFQLFCLFVLKYRVRLVKNVATGYFGSKSASIQDMADINLLSQGQTLIFLTKCIFFTFNWLNQRQSHFVKKITF